MQSERHRRAGRWCLSASSTAEAATRVAEQLAALGSAASRAGPVAAPWDANAAWRASPRSTTTS